ncbi:rhomboid-like protein [Actinomycetospora sp.]|uniref:rhomboid-like protein n=1 Tax=Actinomycetospora sp. TaxID=1872135 RepID=UPI002F41AA2C
MIGAPRRAGAAVALYVTAGPWTVGYVVVLLGVHTWMAVSDRADAFVAWAGTNVVNLGSHPLGALAASALIVNGSLVDPGTMITFWLGVAGALWWLESRYGAARAFVVYLAGHVGATLLTVPVIVAAIHAGRYPEETRTAVDVGISYGAQAALAAAVVTLPRWAWAPGAVFVLGWPLLDADWSGLLPDFTTVGHLIAAGIGFTLAFTWRSPAAVRIGP